MTEAQKIAILESYLSQNVAKMADKEVFRMGQCKDLKWDKVVQQYMVLEVVECPDSELTPDQKDCLLNNAIYNGKL